MNTLEERIITITASPDELRKLADRMDALWPKLNIGKSTFVDFLYYGEKLKIQLHLDQEYYHKRSQR